MKQRIFAVLLIVALLVTATVFAVQADGAIDPKDVFEATQDAAWKDNFTGKTTETVNAVCPWCGGDEVEWKPMSTTSQNLGNGHMYVPTKEGGHEFTALRRIGSNVSGQEIGNICLYLNDQTITFTTRGFNLDTTDQLNIMGNGTVIGGGTATGTNQATIEATKGSVVNICGGTYKSSSARCIVAVYGSEATNQVNFYDGEIVREADVAGPCVRVVDHGEFNMYGGTVSGGTAIDDPDISGTALNGGNFYVKGSATKNRTATLNISGGIVTGGNAAANGGNIFAYGNASTTAPVEVTISGSAVVAGGTASTMGGNICATGANSTVTVDGGTVTGGNNTSTAAGAGNGGGNIAVSGSAKLEVKSGSVGGEATVNGQPVSGGISKCHGGNIYVNAAEAEISGGTVTGGKSAYTSYTTSHNRGGGNIAVHTDGVVTISGTAQITNGDCDYNRGGNVWVKAGTLEMTGGQISGGQADNQGDNVYVHGDGTMTMSGGSIIGADSDRYGNAIYCANGSTLTLDKTAQVYNDAKKGNICMDSTDGAEPTGYANLVVNSTFEGEAYVTISYGTAAHNVGYGKELTNGYSSTGAYTGSLYLEHANYNYAKVFGTADNKLVVAGTALMKDGAIADWAPNNNAAVAAAANFDSIKLYSDEATMTLAGGEYAVDLNGMSVTIDGEGTLNGIDDKTDDYKDDNCGTATVTSDKVQVTNAYEVDGGWYIAIPGGNDTYTFHRLEMAITGVSIRPSAAGIYYWAQWDCDDTLAGCVDSYGIATKLSEFNKDDIKLLMNGTGPEINTYLDKILYTNLGKGKFTACKAQTGALMTGMLKNNDDRTAKSLGVDLGDYESINDMFGKTLIYAVPYIYLHVGDKNITLDCVDSQVSYSLYALVKMVDDAIVEVGDKFYKAMDTFATTWANADLGWTYSKYEAKNNQAASNT